MKISTFPSPSTSYTAGIPIGDDAEKTCCVQTRDWSFFYDDLQSGSTKNCLLQQQQIKVSEADNKEIQQPKLHFHYLL